MASNFPTGLDNFTNPVSGQLYVDGTTVIQAAELNNLQYAIDALEAKVGITGSGVNTSHDYKLAHKGIFYSGATVFNTTVTALSTFQDLDLSSIVGANIALVLLEVKATNPGTLAVKPKGWGGTYADNTPSAVNYIGAGCSVASVSEANNYRYVITATNSSGVIEIGFDTNVTITIKLIVYIK